MDYQTAIKRLLKLEDMERMNFRPRAPGERARYDLRRINALLEALTNPQLVIPTIHIAGTKGKGSIAAMCSSVLAQSGNSVGLYTSPHLHSFVERIRLNDTPVTKQEFADLVEELWPAMETLRDKTDLGEITTFEALTTMAFVYFSRNVRIQVVETGLGGRLDSTNVVAPHVCAIASLSLDHTAVLGETLEQIAEEKAGIIKSDVPVVTAPQPPEAMAVIESACHRKGACLIKVGRDITWHLESISLEGQLFGIQSKTNSYRLFMPLLGLHQLENAAVAVGVMEALAPSGFEIREAAIEDGLRRIEWPCRMEVLSRDPLFICDGAHNPHSIGRLVTELPTYFQFSRVLLIIGASEDKNLDGMAKELSRLEPVVIATRSRHPRAASTSTIAEAFFAQGLEVTQMEDVGMAVDLALGMATDGDLTLATGSLFVAAQAREVIMGIEPEIYPDMLYDKIEVAQ